MTSIYVSVNYDEKRIKAVWDKDCIPTDVHEVFESRSTADPRNRRDVSERFYHFYDKMRWLEQLGFTVCIDFGKYYYETGGEVEVAE